MNHQIELTEEQRQLTLMALAHLSVERPGFDHALAAIALGMDNHTAAQRPQLFDRFRVLHQNPFRPITVAPMDGTWIIGRDGDVIYPCAFDPEQQLWISPVDTHLVAGVLPQEWRYIG